MSEMRASRSLGAGRPLRMSHADAGHASRNSDRSRRTAAGTSARSMLANPNRRKVALGGRGEQVEVAHGPALASAEDALAPASCRHRAPCSPGVDHRRSEQRAARRRSRARPRRRRASPPRRRGRRPSTRGQPAVGNAGRLEERDHGRSRWSAARADRTVTSVVSGFLRPNERTHDAASDFAGQHLGVQSGPGQERLRHPRTRRPGSARCSTPSNPALQQELEKLLSGRARRRCSRPTAPCSCRTAAGTSPRTTTSDTAKRPPGLSTRNASRSTLRLSAERLTTQLEMITSTEASGSGMDSMSPLRNSTFSTPAFRWFSRASASISSVMSRP